MKDEILTGTIKKSNVVVYEVSDEGRERECNHGRHDNAGRVYYTSFVDFIASLGYEFDEDKDAPHFSRIKIRGVDLYVDLHNATYKSFLKFQREIIIRKPENRYIALRSDFSSDKSIVKIHFNKEYDSEKIKAKIDKYIDGVINYKQERIDKEQAKKDNIIALANLLNSQKTLEGKSLSDFCNSCWVSDKRISLNIENAFQLVFSSDLKFSSFHFYDEYCKVEVLGELNNFFTKIEALKVKANVAIKLVESIGTLPDKLNEFVNSAHYDSFDYKTMKINN